MILELYLWSVALNGFIMVLTFANLYRKKVRKFDKLDWSSLVIPLLLSPFTLLLYVVIGASYGIKRIREKRRGILQSKHNRSESTATDRHS